MAEVSTSVLMVDKDKAVRTFYDLEVAKTDFFHIDVMDGKFVKKSNKKQMKEYALEIKHISNIPLDVHLMIEHPQNYIDDFVDAGADIITIHYEATGEMTEDVISHIKSHNVLAGLSIKPKTPPQDILKYLLMVDMVLIMTVEPGFGGQAFMRDCAEKIPVIKQNAPENLIIQVDGGINRETGKICRSLGANSLVAGSYIYKSDDIKDAIESLRK